MIKRYRKRTVCRQMLGEVYMARINQVIDDIDRKIDQDLSLEEHDTESKILKVKLLIPSQSCQNGEY